ncbi:MAG: DHHA1 domain-containing protein, partial [Deltaproteobacteria bacterium]
FVFHQEGWHPGVIGIVASRLVDRYDRPTVVIAVDNGIGRGSARSPRGFDLYESLSVCARYLKKFGGHETAAGFTLRAEEIPAFHEDFEKIVCERSRPEDFLPELIADGEISPWDVSAELADQLSALAPFGTGNPEPLFVLSGMDILSTRKVGTRHLKMRLQWANPPNPRQVRPLDAIFFNPGDGVPQAGNTCRVACHVRWNQWRDQKRIQLIIRDLDAES